MKKIIEKLVGRKPYPLDMDNLLVSAVLLPLVEINGSLALLFEVRSMKLDRQPGEICFPGGRVEGRELDKPADAAIRETAEELGLSCTDIELLAPLGFLFTPRGMFVYPYVGYITAPDQIRPNHEEVDSVFTVPLSFFTTYRPRTSIIDVATRYSEDFPLHRVPQSYHGGWQKHWSYTTYIYEYENYFIWGMTATILHHFLESLGDIILNY